MHLIDTHQHLWRREQFRLPWIEAGSVLDRDYMVEDYASETEGLGVAKTVYMEVDVAEEQQAAEAEWVTGMCLRSDNTMAGAVIGGRPASPEFVHYLDRVVTTPEIKGVRQVLHGASTPRGFCLQPAFVEGVRLLGERGLSFDLCMRAPEIGRASCRERV